MFTKVIAGSAIAMMLVPALAFANEGKGDAGARLHGRIEAQIFKIEHKDERWQKQEDRIRAHASSTSSSIIKKATRIQEAADTMLSFQGRVGALIASSSVVDKAALNAKLNIFASNATSAKAKAGEAITVANQVNASSSASSTLSLIAAARADLKQAKQFLHDAQKAFLSILRALWH